MKDELKNSTAEVRDSQKEEKIKNKRNKAVALITFTLIVIIAGCCIYMNKDIIFKNKEEKVEIYKNIEFVEDLKLEAGEKINIKDYIKKIEGGELIVDNEAINNIDTKKVGKETIKLSVKDSNGEIQEFECKINIVDTTKPEIKVTKEKFEITVGDKVNLLENVSAKDNIDGDLEVKIDGKYDINKEGEYKLEYKAEDKSRNKVEKEFTLKVNKKAEVKTDTSNKKNEVKTNASNKRTQTKQTDSKTNNNTKTNTNTNKTGNTSSKTTTNNNNSQKTSTKSTSSYQSAKGILSLVNNERSKEKVGDLTWSSALEQAAKTRAKEISQSFSHTRPNGSNFYTVSNLAYAENIAKGQTNINSVNNAWKNSSGHYKNMVNAKYKTMGAACCIVNGQYYWVELFGY